MRLRNSFFLCVLIFLCARSANAAGYCSAVSVDTNGKQFRPPDRFPVEKQFQVLSEDKEHRLPDVRKGDVIRISTKNGLKHYRNKRLLNTYKIIPQPATITIQPQCKVAPCPPIDTQVLVYYMGSAERYIDIRNNSLLISDSSYKDQDTSKKALRLKWKKAYGLGSK
ncbi:hypothetical protein LZZ85_27800 [Terrimonas sp. NA20]|uniref:Secreted protein n=1 Tax=Terrimonas ginsenosidimutans TaxID=2908004 RepID=A0ABS9L0N2_9BACT|nr:hypothetical protein [Terrimonas ginsenosidimutans]MCG2618139.1 hypothetical protein [Terrimonas ginsenosidimutans]